MLGSVISPLTRGCPSCTSAYDDGDGGGDGGGGGDGDDGLSLSLCVCVCVRACVCACGFEDLGLAREHKCCGDGVRA